MLVVISKKHLKRNLKFYKRTPKGVLFILLLKYNYIIITINTIKKHYLFWRTVVQYKKITCYNKRSERRVGLIVKKGYFWKKKNTRYSSVFYVY